MKLKLKSKIKYHVEDEVYKQEVKVYVILYREIKQERAIKFIVMATPTETTKDVVIKINCECCTESESTCW